MLLFIELVLSLLAIGYVHGNPKTIYKCSPNVKSVCILKDVQIASPEELLQIDLTKEQQDVRFIDGNIPTFGENLYHHLNPSTNLTITNCNVKQLFVGSKLVRLNASGNQISDLQRDSDVNYSDLKVLDLSNNRLTGVQSILVFVGLKELDLSGNAIESVDIGDFDVLRKLKKLNLGDNPVSVWKFNHGIHLESLEELRLHNTQLLEFNTHDWTLPVLTKLDISSNLLYYLNGKELLESFPDLTNLDLTGNQWACHGLSNLLPILRKHPVELTEERTLCPFKMTSVEGICCEDRYVNYVTMQSQWDVRQLQREVRSMNRSLVEKLDSVRTDQGVQIHALKVQLAEQDGKMREMKQSLVQMDRLIDDLLEELYQRQLEVDQGTRAKARRGGPMVQPVF